MLNKVIIMGRLTADPELRQTPNNVAVCQFTVACDRNFGGRNGEERQTDFISCVVWRQSAEFLCRYFQKGSMIVVEGTLRTRNYQDSRHPEVRHYVTEVQADQLYFGESKKSAGSGNYQQASYPQEAPPETGGGSYQQRNGSSGTQSAVPQEDQRAISIGSLDEFEEILNDGDVPF